MSCDVKEDAHRRERDDEARASVRDERKRDSGQRSEPEDGCDVDHRLAAYECGQARSEPLSEWITTAKGDPKARVGKHDER
jgi:hypothetical protein